MVELGAENCGRKVHRRLCADRPFHEMVTFAYGSSRAPYTIRCCFFLQCKANSLSQVHLPRSLGTNFRRLSLF